MNAKPQRERRYFTEFLRRQCRLEQIELAGRIAKAKNAAIDNELDRWQVEDVLFVALRRGLDEMSRTLPAAAAALSKPVAS